MKKPNCWEFKRCGRELGGSKAYELGVCPASTDISFDSVHGGINAGRACWVVAGTMCSGTVQGTFAQKYRNCGVCDFYISIREEEDDNFVPTVTLIEKFESPV